VPVLRKYFKLLLILLLGGFIHRSHQVHKGTSGDFINELSISASETLNQASPQVKGDSISENL